MQRGDFPRAVAYLKTASQVGFSHRGILKALGYSYLWTGQVDQSLARLSNFPEVRYELDYYPTWWKAQGREDQARYAELLLARILMNDQP